MGGEQFQCTVRGRKGGKVKIRSHHYRSLGNFEDRSGTYAPFIRELVHRISARSSQARFLAGSSVTWAVWLTLAVLWVGVVVLLIAALLDGATLPRAGIAAIVICLIAGPFIWRRIRQGSGREFDPAHPPPGLTGG
jgi:hypothetical protein